MYKRLHEIADLYPIPAVPLLIQITILEFSGHVRFGKHFVSFWCYMR